MPDMRALRNYRPNRCYRLISRIANRAFFLTEEERTRFVDRLWRVAKFSGVEVLAHCFKSYPTTAAPPLGSDPRRGGGRRTGLFQCRAFRHHKPGI